MSPEGMPVTNDLTSKISSKNMIRSTNHDVNTRGASKLFSKHLSLCKPLIAIPYIMKFADLLIFFKTVRTLWASYLGFRVDSRMAEISC